MRKIFYLAGILFFFILVAPAQAKPQPDEKTLAAHLKSHWKTPEDYVISKFKKYNIVFLGEFHRITHDVELVQGCFWGLGLVV